MPAARPVVSRVTSTVEVPPAGVDPEVALSDSHGTSDGELQIAGRPSMTKGMSCTVAAVPVSRSGFQAVVNCRALQFPLAQPSVAPSRVVGGTHGPDAS